MDLNMDKLFSQRFKQLLKPGRDSKREERHLKNSKLTQVTSNGYRGNRVQTVRNGFFFFGFFMENMIE